jgi:uncharacterized membrane protein
VRIRTLAATAILIAGIAGCGPGVPQQQNYATIYGVVYDGTTGQPLPGAVVTVDSVLSATSGADGSFSIADVPIGPFTVVESANGFQQHSDQGTVAAGDHFLLNVSLYK